MLALPTSNERHSQGDRTKTRRIDSRRKRRRTDGSKELLNGPDAAASFGTTHPGDRREEPVRNSSTDRTRRHPSGPHVLLLEKTERRGRRRIERDGQGSMYRRTRRHPSGPHVLLLEKTERRGRRRIERTDGRGFEYERDLYQRTRRHPSGLRIQEDRITG